MPYGIIEPTGCCVRKGKVQLRFSFYLEPSDPRYKEHHIQVPIIPPEGYQGEVDAEGIPVDQVHFNNWIESLPKKWQNNPFHNHFVYVDADTPDAEIKQLMTEALEEFYGVWAEGGDMLEAWKTRTPKARQHFNKSRTEFIKDAPKSHITKCEKKVRDIKKRASEFRVGATDG